MRAASAANKLTTEPIERRERRPVAMRGFVALQHGVTSEILVVDLSYEGCGIEIPVELSAGQAVKLSVLRRGAVGAHVRWYRDGKAGLVFDSLPEAERQQVPRKAKRIDVGAEVSLRRLGQLNYRTRVTDLSPAGCKVELVERPRIGEHVMLKFDGLEVLDSEVCWIEGFVAGLRFEKSFHPAVFDLLLERLR